MTNLEFEMQGIWGELSTWRDEDGNTWLYVPIWGPVSKDAPQLSRHPRPESARQHHGFQAGNQSVDAQADARSRLDFRRL